MIKKPELLAPAGERDSLVAAVQNGADAVYLGGRMFNARQSAANFSREELAWAVEYAHVRGVRVYVTVNTLIADSELEEAVRFLHYLYDIGVDAVIVQDLGLVRLARQVIPELELHASTQMTVHNLPASRLLKEAGIKRIILARELSLEAVREIKEKAGIEVEVFVHGALCICFSGQCLMSSIIGGRSGNRGRCAQPCRMPYYLADADGKLMADPARVGEYLLSPRDLNVSECLPELVGAGVDSFKIEGRMKRPEYVATVVRIYRQLIDRAAEGNFFITPEEATELAQIFNRGFTTGYFFGRPGLDLMSCKRPNNRGVRLGKITRCDRAGGRVAVKLDAPLRVGDGIEVWVSRGGRVGTEVREIFTNGSRVDRVPAGAEVWLHLEGAVHPGDRVFKTHDASLMEKARATFTSPRERRKIPLRLEVWARVGEPLVIRAVDPDGIKSEAQTEVTATVALKRPLTREVLLEQLDRMGNTPFAIGELKCHIEGEVMVPVSEINEARRRLLERLAAARAAARSNPVLPGDLFEHRLTEALEEGAGPAFRAGRHPVLAAAVSDLDSVRAAVAGGAGVVYFGGESFCSKKKVTREDIRAAREICAEREVSYVFSTPRILLDDEMGSFLLLLEEALALPADGILVANLGFFSLIKEISGEVPVVADFALNVFNRQTVDFLADQGAVRVTLSPELTLNQVGFLARKSRIPVEVLVHGAIPLMVSRYCVVGGLLGGAATGRRCAGPCRSLRCGLVDRRGVFFPLEMDRNCYMHVFNSRDLCMLRDVAAILDLGVSVLRVEARREGAEYTAAAVKAYRRAVDMYLTGEKRLALLDEMLQELARFCPAGFTRGHYYRGVM